MARTVFLKAAWPAAAIPVAGGLTFTAIDRVDTGSSGGSTSHGWAIVKKKPEQTTICQ